MLAQEFLAMMVLLGELPERHASLQIIHDRAKVDGAYDALKAKYLSFCQQRPDKAVAPLILLPQGPNGESADMIGYDLVDVQPAQRPFDLWIDPIARQSHLDDLR